ncbi:MAG TPA: HAMP domain-containing sensor histidine kinase [Candidatus Angelobacter sp.]|nr:HAMP domain-containing sensor histidine kinase [Candidatus Angelobacter sp.]
MKIRTRLTLWYAAILIVSLIVMGAGVYQEIAEQLHRDHSKDVWEYALDEASEMVFCVGFPAILLGLLGGWWITRKTLGPVTALTEAVERKHDGNLRERLPSSGNGDELDRLTQVFNAMTSRLDDSFQRIREFTLHASHELKTPLTVMRGELEMTLIEENLTAGQKERVLSQLDEVERLAKIVDGLTLLTKADTGQIKLDFEPIRLDELVRESVADAKILGQPNSIHVHLAACENTVISGDRDRLRQLLLNLTDNAVKYNEPGGKVNISLSQTDGFAELKIENTGPGVAPELQPRVFERFFRGDTSHSGDVEGCGLGLSIAQWIAVAHQGTIQFASRPGELTTVTVRLLRDGGKINSSN